MSRLSQRIVKVAESATLAIDAKAKAMKQAGEDVVGFGAGEADFPTPDHIVDAAVAAARDPRNHRYSPVPGLPQLREAIAAKTKRDSGLEVTAAEVMVTNGGKHAIYNAFAAILDPGDEVLLPAPYWTTYPESVQLNDGVCIEVPTGMSSGFKASVEDFERLRTDRTKAIVMVSPSNPTGVVYDAEELTAIGKWAVANQLWVLTDEIYEHLVYGGTEQNSLPVLVPELRDRCIVVNGVAKTWAMTGWRVGWIIAPQDVIKATTNLQSHSTSNVAGVSQQAALAAVTDDLRSVYDMREAFDRRRRRMLDMLNEIPGFDCIEPRGAFYCFPNVEGALGRSIGSRSPESSMQLAEAFLEEAKVAAIPGEAFGAPGYLRFSYALSDTDLEEGLTRLQKVLAI